MNDLAVIILNYNTKDLLRKCINSVLDKKWKNNIEVWVVDNASSDGSVEMVKKEFPKIKLIISEENLGFAGGNNLALQKVHADYYLLLNSDTELTEGSLDNMLEAMEKNKFDIVSCKLVNADDSLQPNVGDLPFGIALFSWLFGLDDLPYLKNLLPSFHRTAKNYYEDEKAVGWVSGTAFMISKNVLKSIGLLDEKIFMYCEDVDYCIRSKGKGFVIGFTDKAIIKHIGGASSADPKLRQWLGEFKELIYLQRKYNGKFAANLVKILIYFAILFRILGFSLMGKFNYTNTYSKILFKL